jgi:hypothetical protein
MTEYKDPEAIHEEVIRFWLNISSQRSRVTRWKNDKERNI